MPLGGPPFFFINGLVGGLGLNRDLTLPSIDEVENHLLIQSLGGFSDPMDALASIKPQFPVKYGSFWFALGLKFKTVEIMETRAVLLLDLGMTSPLDYSVYRQWIFQNHPSVLRTLNLQSLHTMTAERTFYGYKPNLPTIRTL